MNNNLKKVFFSSLLAVLFVISNLIGLKYTNFMGLVVSVNFITYPFIILCILLLINMFNKHEAYVAITITLFIQIFILLSYTLAINLGNQAVIPDMASEVNSLFRVDEYHIMASLIGFMISNYILIYIYDYFKIIRYKLIGVVLSCLVANVIYGLIVISISNYYFGFEILLNMLLCHIIMSVIMTIIVTVLFYLLKDKENIYEEKKVFVNDINVKVFNDTSIEDKPILEVIEKTENKVSRKINKKKSSKNTNKNYKKPKNNGKVTKKRNK